MFFLVTLLLFVKLFPSVAYYPSVTSLFLFNSFPTCSIQMRARPLSSIAISVTRQIGFDSMYVYIKIQKLLWPLQNKGKDILSPEGRFYYCFLRQLTNKSRFFFKLYSHAKLPLNVFRKFDFLYFILFLNLV